MLLKTRSEDWYHRKRSNLPTLRTHDSSPPTYRYQRTPKTKRWNIRPWQGISPPSNPLSYGNWQVGNGELFPISLPSYLTVDSIPNIKSYRNSKSRIYKRICMSPLYPLERTRKNTDESYTTTYSTKQCWLQINPYCNPGLNGLKFTLILPTYILLWKLWELRRSVRCYKELNSQGKVLDLRSESKRRQAGPQKRRCKRNGADIRFHKMLSTDELRAWYGPDHVALAVDRGAVGTLLISDNLFRYVPLPSSR